MGQVGLGRSVGNKEFLEGHLSTVSPPGTRTFSSAVIPRYNGGTYR